MKIIVYATISDPVGELYELVENQKPIIGEFGALILHTTLGLRIFADGSWAWLREVK